MSCCCVVAVAVVVAVVVVVVFVLFFVVVAVVVYVVVFKLASEIKRIEERKKYQAQFHTQWTFQYFSSEISFPSLYPIRQWNVSVYPVLFVFF